MSCEIGAASGEDSVVNNEQATLVAPLPVRFRRRSKTPAEWVLPPAFVPAPMTPPADGNVGRESLVRRRRSSKGAPTALERRLSSFNLSSVRNLRESIASSSKWSAGARTRESASSLASRKSQTRSVRQSDVACYFELDNKKTLKRTATASFDIMLANATQALAKTSSRSEAAQAIGLPEGWALYAKARDADNRGGYITFKNPLGKRLAASSLEKELGFLPAGLVQHTSNSSDSKRNNRKSAKRCRQSTSSCSPAPASSSWVSTRAHRRQSAATCQLIESPQQTLARLRQSKGKTSVGSNCSAASSVAPEFQTHVTYLRGGKRRQSMCAAPRSASSIPRPGRQSVRGAVNNDDELRRGLSATMKRQEVAIRGRGRGGEQARGRGRATRASISGCIAEDVSRSKSSDALEMLEVKRNTAKRPRLEQFEREQQPQWQQQQETFLLLMSPTPARASLSSASPSLELETELVGVQRLLSQTVGANITSQTPRRFSGCLQSARRLAACGT